MLGRRTEKATAADAREKRRHLRARIAVPVACRLSDGGSPFEAVACDVGLGGMRLRIDRLPEASVADFFAGRLRFSLSFRLPSSEGQIEAPATMAWARQDHDGRFSVGLEFTDLDGADATAIWSYVNRHLAHRSRPVAASRWHGQFSDRRRRRRRILFACLMLASIIIGLAVGSFSGWLPRAADKAKRAAVMQMQAWVKDSTEETIERLAGEAQKEYGVEPAPDGRTPRERGDHGQR